MFEEFFGEYLVKTGKLTSEQMLSVKEVMKTARVKLGLIAVAEKMLTESQADEINRLQAVMDKRFGDIAVEKGYLTDDQIVEKLKEHTVEVFAAVLGYVYPTMTAEEYKKVVINFYTYGPNVTYTCAFEVVGTGKFEYIADSLQVLE